MAFKGSVQARAAIAVTLELAHNAGGEAYLFVAAAQSGGAPLSDEAIVAPGGSATVTLRPPGRGRLEIAVDARTATDSATLTVREDQTTKDRAPIAGDVFWAYMILPPA